MDSATIRCIDPVQIRCIEIQNQNHSVRTRFMGEAVVQVVASQPWMGLSAHGVPSSSSAHDHFQIPPPISVPLISCLSSLSCPIKKIKTSEPDPFQVLDSCLGLYFDGI